MTSERGSLSIIAITGALTLSLFALAAADLGAMVLARARAQAAADAAALAAVVQQVPALGQGSDPEAAARAEAERNGATMVRCVCRDGESTAEVSVTVPVVVAYIAGWFGKEARADARAQVDPDVLSYRSQS